MDYLYFSKIFKQFEFWILGVGYAILEKEIKNLEYFMKSEVAIGDA